MSESQGRVSRLEKNLGLCFGIWIPLDRHFFLTFFQRKMGYTMTSNYFDVTQEEKGKLFSSSLFQTNVFEAGLGQG